MSKSINGLLIGIIIIGFILLNIGASHSDSQNNLQSNCRKSTFNNPFANYIITDRTMNPNLAACINMDDKIRNNYMNNLYINSDDSINRYYFNNYEKNYMTMPVTIYPNKQRLYGNYLYNNKAIPNSTCKLDQYCINYKDIRFNRRFV